VQRRCETPTRRNSRHGLVGEVAAHGSAQRQPSSARAAGNSTATHVTPASTRLSITAALAMSFARPDNSCGSSDTRSTTASIAEFSNSTISTSSRLAASAARSGRLTGTSTITGVSAALRRHYPDVIVVAVEPDRCAVLSGDPPGPHKIQGIGAGFVPPVLDRAAYDHIARIDDEAAYRMKQRLAREEGLLVGISAGAAMVAALDLAARLGPGKHVVTVLCDTGERYFSLDEYFTANGARA